MKMDADTTWKDWFDLDLSDLDQGPIWVKEKDDSQSSAPRSEILTRV